MSSTYRVSFLLLSQEYHSAEGNYKHKLQSDKKSPTAYTSSCSANIKGRIAGTPHPLRQTSDVSTEHIR